MKPKLVCFSFVLLLSTGLGRAESGDPLSENTFSPELLLFYQSEIGLSDDVRNALITQVQKTSERISELDRIRKKEAEALADLLKESSVDEPAALAQLDNLLDRERDIKRVHLSLVLGMKNKLTPEQQAKLAEIKNKIAGGQLLSPQELQRHLQEKLQKVQEGVQQWQNDNRDPAPIGEIMEEFDPLMKEGKHKEAEAVLDRALKRLSEPPKNN